MRKTMPIMFVSIIAFVTVATSQPGLDKERRIRYEALRDSARTVQLKRQRIDSVKWAHLRQVDPSLDSTDSFDLRTMAVFAEIIAKGLVVANPVTFEYPIVTSSGRSTMWGTSAVNVRIEKVYKCQPVDSDVPPAFHPGDVIRALDFQYTSGVTARRAKRGGDERIYAGDSVYLFLTRHQLRLKNPTSDDYRTLEIIPVIDGQVSYFKKYRAWTTTTTTELENDIHSVTNVIEGGRREN